MTDKQNADYVVTKAYTERNGRMVHRGWHVIQRGFWCQTFATKQEAVAAIKGWEAAGGCTTQIDSSEADK